ncbi:hypothetical protein BCIN_02g07360 [Botrytis cinerea B05.10]|uniref:Uncharacterized protein n=1 Tax=Botryotinia fuckeliana (strain B05.10) TaxID=332648 RepID=A0A384JAE2_BOTFB|nr:hypothetical protein BCIN_02g07360 [Botrytis cinerea B05.10]ATZ47460.1 hypothetical protein BCIN_02g07360 [Botrytis cinerea B05.10]
MIDTTEEPNFRIFLDCISTPLIEQCTSASNSNTSKRKTRKAKAGRKTAIKPLSKEIDVEEARINDAAELAEFIEVRSFYININESLCPKKRILIHKISTSL